MKYHLIELNVHPSVKQATETYRQTSFKYRFTSNRARVVTWTILWLNLKIWVYNILEYINTYKNRWDCKHKYEAKNMVTLEIGLVRLVQATAQGLKMKKQAYDDY
jgi:hypothetical protein